MFVRPGAVDAAEAQLHSIDDLSVSSLIHLAPAVGTNIQTWLNGRRDDPCKSLEELCGQLPTFIREGVYLPLLLTHHLRSVGYQSTTLKFL